MRTQLPVIRYVVLLLALVFTTSTVVADSRSEARTHYQAGVKFYAGGDYRSAIREFSAAQQLAPADLNNYNLALCYDKLGDPEPAIQYYRAFLDKQPSSDKRAEIEASISRLEAAAKSIAAKKAAEAAKAEEARRVAEAKEAEKARKAEAAARKAEDAKRAEEARKRPPVQQPDTQPQPDGQPEVRPEVQPEVGVEVQGRAGVGSTGTPGNGTTVSTGDAQLDRVARIDINQIRDGRTGGAASGVPDPRGGPATTDPQAGASIQAGAGVGAGTPPTAGAQPQAAGVTPDPADKPKAKPVYKKWWFWAVVAVSAYVVYSIASEDSSSNSRGRELPPMPNTAPAASGMTLMRW